MQEVVLIGFGAIGQAILQGLPRTPQPPPWRISHAVVRAARVAEVQAQLDAAASRAGGVAAQAVSTVPAGVQCVLECAGHGALVEHVLPALARGTECALLSVGALAEAGLAEQLARAAVQGGTRLH
ncbi:MAG: aspartate dehydrogenase, partial [Rhodoferax sp.]|nr:aspartate dehydrogenase [Rhodoferax sp.]